jgi:hypothetical protein
MMGLPGSPRAAALATAGLAAALLGLGLVAANADIVEYGSLETAPDLICPNADRVLLPHGAADHVLDAALTPAQVAVAYVQANEGWTKDHMSVLNTIERPVAGSAPQQVEVDLRDAANRRLAVFVVTRNGTAWQLTRTFECASPLPEPKKPLKDTFVPS